jgi:hypothetical protein
LKVPVVPTKVAKLVIKVIAQPIKPTKVPLRYPYIIYFNFEHCVPNCLRKVQNMFQIKPNTTTTITSKNPKPDNVLVNVVAAITTCSQTSEQ